MRKGKIAKIIFLISLMPYLILLLFGLWSTVFGFSWFFSTSYGIDAFISSIFVYGYLFSPILLICIVYQAIYLLSKYLGN